ncbi:MAG TPA: hypothetical protein VEJ45_07320 [Candidatus Acidoferrales bacterium]|nr:hypothetical protein [Candidatus Acidoferrales bacterium]
MPDGWKPVHVQHRFVCKTPEARAASGSMSGIEVIVLGGETNTYSYVTSASLDK